MSFCLFGLRLQWNYGEKLEIVPHLMKKVMGETVLGGGKELYVRGRARGRVFGSCERLEGDVRGVWSLKPERGGLTVLTRWWQVLRRLVLKVRWKERGGKVHL